MQEQVREQRNQSVSNRGKRHHKTVVGPRQDEHVAYHERQHHRDPHPDRSALLLQLVGLLYTQQIFNPPLKGEQHAAEQRAEEQRLSMDDVRDTVMSRAALDYLELAKVRHALELMHSERTSAGRILEATRERADTGRELPIEVIRAQLTTARIEQRIAQMEDRDDSLSGELRDMMGMPSDEMIEVSTEEIPGAAAEASKDVVSEAMANNVELKQAQTELRAREFKLKGEQGGPLAVVRPDRPVQCAEQDQ